MQKNLDKLIADNSKKLNKMIEEKKSYKELLKQSEILDDYIMEYYNQNKEIQ